MKDKTSFYGRGMRYPVILALLCLTLLEAQAYVYISGPTTVCANSTASFYAQSTDYQCSYNYSWTAYQNGQLIASSGGPYFYFSVGSSTSSISISMYANPIYGDCYYSSDYRNVAVVVGQTPGTPSAVSITHVSGYLYDLSTSSANATSYEWSVSGATIQGSTTGATARVLASHDCYFSFQVRGRNTACGTSYSSWVSGSKTINAPLPPTYVSVPGYIYSGASMLQIAVNEPADPGVCEWSLSDPGGALWLTPGSPTAYISHNGSYSPVVREAIVSVRRTSACGVSPTVTGLTRYGGGSFRIDPGTIELSQDEPQSMAVSPNPVNSNSAIIVKLPRSKESTPKQMLVLNLSGEVVMKREIKGDAGKELEIAGLGTGMYLVKIVGTDNKSHTQRLIVK